MNTTGQTPQTAKAAGPNIWSVLIAGGAIGAIIVLILFLFNRFTGTFDQTSALIALVSAVVAPIGTIAAAAFGVTVGAQTAAAASQKVIDDKQAQVDQVTEGAATLANRVRNVRTSLGAAGGSGFAPGNLPNTSQELAVIEGELAALGRR